jgi:hypothetical protein
MKFKSAKQNYRLLGNDKIPARKLNKYNDNPNRRSTENTKKIALVVNDHCDDLT